MLLYTLLEQRKQNVGFKNNAVDYAVAYSYVSKASK